MIQQTLVMLLLLASAQAIASAPCPTCKKGYVASSLEEVLIARQKAQRLDLKAILGGSLLSQGKKAESAQEQLPITKIVNRTRQDASQPYIPRLHTPNRNEILGTIGASPDRSQTRSLYFAQEQSNRNLRGTFDRTMAFGMQQQLQQRIRNPK